MRESSVRSDHATDGSADTFTFGVQGDSHPERLDRMYHPDLYVRTMEIVRHDRPDFYITLGDDFSVDPLYNRNNLNLETVQIFWFYNKAAFQKAGITTVPTTWPQLLADCAKLIKEEFRAPPPSRTSTDRDRDR